MRLPFLRNNGCDFRVMTVRGLGLGVIRGGGWVTVPLGSSCGGVIPSVAWGTGFLKPRANDNWVVVCGGAKHRVITTVCTTPNTNTTTTATTQTEHRSIMQFVLSETGICEAILKHCLLVGDFLDFLHYLQLPIQNKNQNVRAV